MPNSKFDRHPQFLRRELEESGNNTFTEGSVNTPVSISNTKGKMFCMELLRAFVQVESGGLAAGDEILFAIYDRTRSAMPRMSDPGVIIADRGLCVLNTSGEIQNWETHVYDFHDGNGNGPLYAGREMFLAVQGVSQGTTITMSAAIEYRLVEVDAEEFIGIVQS